MQAAAVRPRGLVRVTGRQGVFAVVSVTGDLVEVVHAETGRGRIVPVQRISRGVRPSSRAGRVADFLHETQTAYDYRAGKVREEDADLVDVIAAVAAAPRNADGSYSIRVSEQRLRVLWEYGDYLIVAASDDAGESMSALADVNAGRAMLRRVERLRS